MCAVWQGNSIGASSRSVLLVLAAVMATGLPGCAARPLDTFRGARHYAAGTRALDRQDAVRAVAELERAASLVPHASEIQNHLGLAYWSQGRLEAARTAFEHALELDCENRAAQANLERLVRANASSVDGAQKDRLGAVDQGG